MLRFPYKLVTFDVNGTLLNLGPIGTTYAGIAKNHGVTVHPERIQTAFKSAYKAMDKKHPNFGLRGPGWRSWWTAVVKETFPSADVDSTKMDAIAGDLIRHYSTGKPWRLHNRAVDVLNRIKPHAVLGIISNTDPRLHDVLRDHNLHAYFAFVLTSYEAGVAKPSVGIFKRAGELYKKHSGSALNPEEALHVGNSYELDFLAAQKAGWHSVLVHAKGPIGTKDCLAFKNLTELEDHVAQLHS